MKLKNPGKLVFEAEIIAEENSGGAFVKFPYEVEELFGTRGRVPVLATFDGEPYRGSLVKMGMDCHLLLVLKDIRQKIGKQAGDLVQITVELDDQMRVIEIPRDFQTTLDDNAKANEMFKQLSYSHQRDYVLWIEEAKKETTRQRRRLKAVELLAAGKRLK
jgi:hypothetical protein